MENQLVSTFMENSVSTASYFLNFFYLYFEQAWSVKYMSYFGHAHQCGKSSHWKFFICDI